MPTQIKENYLKAIFFLSQKNVEVSITELSNQINVSKPTANNMVNKMEKKEIGTMVFTEYKDRFQLFIGLALLLLIIDLMLLGRKNKWSNRINFYKD